MNGGSVYFLNHSTFDAVRAAGRRWTRGKPA